MDVGRAWSGGQQGGQAEGPSINRIASTTVGHGRRAARGHVHTSA